MKPNEPAQVLILVPTLGRDLRGHALVGFRLVERGIGVSYASLAEARAKFRRERPEVLVLDSMSRQSNFELATEAREAGARVAILSTAGFFQSEDCEVEWAGGAREVGTLVDRFFAWGTRGADLLVRRGMLEARQIAVTGSPRFDLYSPPFRGLVRDRATFASALGFASHGAPLVAWATNTWFSRAGQLGRDLPVHLIRDIEDERLQFEHLSRLLEGVWKSRSDWNFVIKIHPAEQAAPYQQLAAAHPHVRVSREVPIDEVLTHCEVLIQRCSTTATEAWMCGKPVIEPGLGGYHFPAREEYSRGNDHVTTSEELAGLVEGYLAGRVLPPAQRAHRQDFLQANYGSLDGGASERIAGEIQALLRAPGSRRPVAGRRRPRPGLREMGTTLRLRLGDRVRKVMGLPSGASLLPWRRPTIAAPAGPDAGLWDAEVRPEVVAALYASYARVLRSPAGGREPASAGRAVPRVS